MRFQKLMWRNMMRSTKSQKASVLHYSIDFPKKQNDNINQLWFTVVYLGIVWQVMQIHSSSLLN
jgi:hypothetical protein